MQTIPARQVQNTAFSCLASSTSKVRNSHHDIFHSCATTAYLGFRRLDFVRGRWHLCRQHVQRWSNISYTALLPAAMWLSAVSCSQHIPRVCHIELQDRTAQGCPHLTSCRGHHFLCLLQVPRSLQELAATTQGGARHHTPCHSRHRGLGGFLPFCPLEVYLAIRCNREPPS